MGGALLEAGVEIHEYAPSFLHAMWRWWMRWAIGLGPRWARPTWIPLSPLLAREANVGGWKTLAFARDLRQRPAHAMRECLPIYPARYAGRP